VSARLKIEFPNLDMKGEYYTPPQPRPFLAQITQAVMMGGMLLIVSGEGIFQSLGRPVPAIVEQLRENMMASMMFIFFLGNNIAQGLMNSGAFEVTYNGVQVWSKLETGRLPTWPELITSMQSAGLPAINKY